MTLTEFLLARIAEDEAHAQRYHQLLCLRTDYDADERPCTCGHPSRVLAECVAKRLIIHMSTTAGQPTGLNPPGVALQAVERAYREGEAFMANGVLQALALPYAEHPDYRPEWKP